MLPCFQASRGTPGPLPTAPRVPQAHGCRRLHPHPPDPPCLVPDCDFSLEFTRNILVTALKAGDRASAARGPQHMGGVLPGSRGRSFTVSSATVFWRNRGRTNERGPVSPPSFFLLDRNVCPVSGPPLYVGAHAWPGSQAHSGGDLASVGGECHPHLLRQDAARLWPWTLELVLERVRLWGCWSGRILHVRRTRIGVVPPNSHAETTVMVLGGQAL